MAERGVLCLLIGIAVLVAPHFLASSGWHDMIAGAATVGWFAVVMGIALIVDDLVHRAKGKTPR